jgi:hypothetical protein
MMAVESVELTQKRRPKTLPKWSASTQSEPGWMFLPEELPGHGGIVVRFSSALLAKQEKVDAEWLFAIDELDVAERAADLEEAKRRAADRLAEDVNRLTRAFVDELSRAERQRRTKLLAHIDLLGGELGIDFPSERWLLGRVKGTQFEPVQDDFRPLVLPPFLHVQEPSDPDKLWFARVATYRDGRPKGEILKLEPAPDEGSAAGTP